MVVPRRKGLRTPSRLAAPVVQNRWFFPCRGIGTFRHGPHHAANGFKLHTLCLVLMENQLAGHDKSQKSDEVGVEIHRISEAPGHDSVQLVRL